MSRLQVLIPMGGLGSRFSQAGFSMPKPLIDVKGLPMYQRAIAALADYPGEIKLLAVVRREHETKYQLGTSLETGQPPAEVIYIDADTRGAAETGLAASEYLDLNEPLLVMDCDIAFESKEFIAEIMNERSQFDGALLSFGSKDPRYSYAKVGELGELIQTAEKSPISGKALVGTYFFRKAAYFVNAAQLLLQEALTTSTPEYYMSSVFNKLLELGLSAKVVDGIFYSFGTPAELTAYVETGQPIQER